MSEHYLMMWFCILVGYTAGYVIGRIDFVYRVAKLFAGHVADSVADRPQDFFKKAAAESQAKAANKIEINDSKFVAPVKTDALQKSEAISLGKTTTAQDDIQASVSKLAQLKGK